MSEPLTAGAPWAVYPTALLEGISVIVVEIAGARALAPFFGTSLQVWTAQITVTLFFLALGYGLGGLLAKRVARWTVPGLFALAGAWLAMYPLLRTPILDFSSQLGVAIGSLVSAALLFGIPLMLLGAISPVLIAGIDSAGRCAGSAAGRLFFTNTMGGLAGGWVTAFVLIPYSSLRLSLVATGILLLALASIWAMLSKSRTTPVVLVLLGGAATIFAVHKPSRTFADKYGRPFDVLYSRQSGMGLLQVLDFAESRMLLINGVIQSEMDRSSGRAVFHYIHSQHALSYSLHPDAKSALQLGLGAGLLPKDLVNRGVKVTAVEIEPRIVELARTFFGLPDRVEVKIADARTFLRGTREKYDLIFLDTFASESTPWHLLTSEALTEMKERLNPGGRLLINTVAYADPARPGLAGVESSVLAAFKQAMVYPERPNTPDPEELVNVTIVAGESLSPQMKLPAGETSMTMLARLIADSRPAEARGPATSDDRSDLDYVQAPLRIRWRTLIWDSMHSNLLWD